MEQPDGRTNPVRRIASVVALTEGKADEYRHYHRTVWPEVLKALSLAHITNYSIYRHGDLLFSYFEYRGADYEADMDRLATDWATQQWWSIMMPLQRTLREHQEQPWWTELPELFHLD